MLMRVIIIKRLRIYCFNLTRSCCVICKEFVASNSELEDVGIFGGRRRGRITLSSCSRISQPRCIRNARAVIDDNKHGFKTHRHTHLRSISSPSFNDWPTLMIRLADRKKPDMVCFISSKQN